MPIKKSELYSTLWKGCDELRGGMDASQYKDYVLVLLFIKYVSDKYTGKKNSLIDIPKGASFKDLVALKGKTTIGEQMNVLIGKLAEANNLSGIITVADFDDENKLGRGKELVDRLTNLIGLFENPDLDFSSNRAEDDDILGDAFEYLMRHFATESGKSKGQFYTPSEVSRIIAKVIGINKKNAIGQTSVYDPTCGSGSLLLKVADEAGRSISLFGQENDNATRALAVMNMWLHGNEVSDIRQGNTLASPEFRDDKTGSLKTFDYVVANPPFSYKAWSNGINPEHDVYERFSDYGTPPAKNGDYAFLLHIIKSMKSKGKGACILPHGVLFRGNAEGDIRKNLIKRGYIKGIIGLPANLFYGTGIPACILVLDKENAEARKGIFMIDASKGFIKDGSKNRLREQDIHKIVDVFNKQTEVPKFSRVVSLDEIEKNEYNLNIPRYIDSQEEEDIQDIDAHLHGGIPMHDIDGLSEYWSVYPSLRKELFKNGSRKGYMDLSVAREQIKPTIFNHPEFIAYGKVMSKAFDTWKAETTALLKKLDKGLHPKQIIQEIAENLLSAYTDVQLIDRYDVYQHLLSYWAEVMQDDMYEISDDGWKAGNQVTRKIIKGKEAKDGKKATKDKEVPGIEGLVGRLIPPALLIDIYFAKEKEHIDELESSKESVQAKMQEMIEEHGGEDGLLSEVVEEEKISKGSLIKRVKELGKRADENADEFDKLEEYKKLMDGEAELSAQIKSAWKDVEQKVIKKYPTLTVQEIKEIVVDKKWIATVEAAVTGEANRISQRLALRIDELSERYERVMSELENDADQIEVKVKAHLETMGYVLQ